MYPPKFDYYRAESVQEAVSLLQKYPDAKLLAGGHSLIPVLKLRLADPGVVIDIGRLPGMKGIDVRNGSTLIGALTTHTMVENADNLPHALPEAAGWIADPSVRNRGTVGGNVAHADPASDLPTVLLALGGVMHTMGANSERRALPIDSFFTDLFETALKDDEILMAVQVPSKAAGTGSAYAKLFNPASRYAMVGSAASITMANGVCTAARVAIGGLTPKAQRCPSVEAELIGSDCGDDAVAKASAAVANDLNPDDVTGDIHASAEYRRSVCPEFVKRAVTKAVARA